ncbi:MAG: hypothetical protein Q8K86_08320 [Candidatus Nanopelagicaceae bacterium]|nr:hypothetical protein [Candidatus Nanopelagicaceae bacterium]
MLDLCKIRLRLPGKQRLSLMIFIRDGVEKIVALDSKSVPKRDADAIRRMAGEFDRMSPDEVVGWLRDNVPYTYKHAYRTLKKDAVDILERMKMKPLLPLPAEQPPGDVGPQQLGDRNPS